MSEPHKMLVATELTTEDMLGIFIDLATKLTYQRDQAIQSADAWKGEFEMYRAAWLREMGGKLFWKAHDIDSFVKTARHIYARAEKWTAYENGMLGRDPFWMVPVFSEPDTSKLMAGQGTRDTQARSGEV